MSSEPKRSRARELAATHLADGDTFGWFEPLYAEAGGDPDKIPWADRRPNPNLTDWLETERIRGDGRTALVIGCGLGDDAQLLAELGFRVTAFDVASTAISWCRKRFPQSPVCYEAADLLDMPSAWRGAFDFVLEAYTLQVLPPGLRAEAILKTAEPADRWAGARHP